MILHRPVSHITSRLMTDDTSIFYLLRHLVHWQTRLTMDRHDLLWHLKMGSAWAPNFPVGGGHLTDVPMESVYSGVVSLWGVRMVTFLSELNGMELAMGYRHRQCLSGGLYSWETVYCGWTWIWGTGRTHAHHFQGTVWTQNFRVTLAWAIFSVSLREMGFEPAL
jgi:hypothetical protein